MKTTKIYFFSVIISLQLLSVNENQIWGTSAAYGAQNNWPGSGTPTSPSHPSSSSPTPPRPTFGASTPMAPPSPRPSGKAVDYGQLYRQHTAPHASRAVKEIEVCHRGLETLFLAKASPAFLQAQQQVMKGYRYFTSTNKFSGMLRNFRQKRLSWYMILNNNPRPILYVLGGQDPAVPTIMAFRQSLEEQGIFEGVHAKTIQQWIEDYKAYPKKFETLVNEASSLAYNIEAYKLMGDDIKKNSQTMGHPVEIDYHSFSKEGKEVSKRLLVEDEAELHNLIHIAKERLSEIEGSMFKRQVGELEALQFNQVLLARQLELLKREMTEVSLNHSDGPAAEGERPLPEIFQEFFKDLKATLQLADLRPSQRHTDQILSKELASEADALHRTKEELLKRLGERTQAIIDALPESEKQRLKLDRFNEFWKAFKYGRLGAFYTLMASGTSVGAYSIWNLYWNSSDQQYKCIQANNDRIFYDCMVNYIKGRSPFEYGLALMDTTYRPFDFSDPNFALDPQKAEMYAHMTQIVAARVEFLKDGRVLSLVAQDLYTALNNALMQQKAAEGIPANYQGNGMVTGGFGPTMPGQPGQPSQPGQPWQPAQPTQPGQPGGQPNPGGTGAPGSFGGFGGTPPAYQPGVGTPIIPRS